MSTALALMARFARGAGRSGNSPLTGRGKKGFTLVEVLIAMFIASIVAAALYTAYNTFFRQANVQDMMVESQQNARVAINLMEKEILNAGYLAGTADIITKSDNNGITFRYVDPNDATLAKYDVTYGVTTASGVTYLTRKADLIGAGGAVTPGNTEKVVPYVNTLAFKYYDSTGGDLSYPTDQNTRNNIKFVTVNLTTRTKGEVQQFSGTGAVTGTAAKTFSVETHVRLRNIGAGTTVADSTPPAPPTGLKVRDPGLCGRLSVQWNNNTEGDLAGYKIYYGDAPGTYIGSLTIPLTALVDPSAAPQYSCTKTSSTMTCTINPATPALSNTPSTTAAGSGTMYYVAVKAYDNAQNLSAQYGTAAANPANREVYGNPATSNADFASGSDDSTLNPTKPTAVTGLIGTNAGEKQVRLTWSAYNTTSRPDVVGFRVYRSTSAFTAYPLDPATQPSVRLVAAEPGRGVTVLGPTATGFTDTGSDVAGGLMGCYVYYYAIAPVNCDTTLITDEGGDPAAKKYVQTDYSATCGNGVAACSAGTGFASVAGSDTAPVKTSLPGSPSINARAGWQRVAITLTQPPVVPPKTATDDPDIDRTCVYGIAGSSYPSISTTKDATMCFVPTSPAVRIPEGTGVFPVSNPGAGQTALARSSTTTFWNNSLSTLTSIPSLANLQTYSYAAVAFDLCGNASNPSDAQATTTLCGEDPVGKPPAVGDFGPASASCCSTPVSLTWTAVPSNVTSPSTATNPWDLAGYRIFKSTSSTDWSGAVLLNPSAPLWGTVFDDTGTLAGDTIGLADGGTYYYRIVSTDCPYENGNDAGHAPINAAQIRSDMISGYLKYTQVGPVKPGKIDRDQKCQGVGTCTKTLHREVLTGVSIDNSSGNGNNSPTPQSSYRHNTVSLFADNTSAGTMTIQKITVAWVNPSAVLTEVSIGGGRSGFSAITTNIDTTLSTAYTGNSPYTTRVLNKALSPVTVNAKTSTLYNVPIKFTFKQYDSASGTYVSTVDMRDDQLLVSLYVRNDSTGTVDCVTYLTTSGGNEGIYVPYGPSVSAVSQDNPTAPTFAYAVPGTTGLNSVPNGSNGQIVVNAATNVSVTADISGQTANEVSGGTIAVSSATLYWVASDKTVTSAPSIGYTAISMTNTSGNTWKTSTAIPTQNGKRVWYYIIATDADGNWDRDPEIGDGAYVYDQKDVNVCDLTPSAPAGLTATPNGAAPYTVTLNWNAVTTYTGGGLIIGSDTIKYRVYKGGVLLASDLTSTTYTDPTPLAGGLTAGVYSYTIRATNSCASPGPNVSSDSNTAAACVGNSGQATISVSPTTINRGQSYTVTINDCYAINGAYSGTIEVINSSPSFLGFSNTSGGDPAGINPTITESGPATGSFTKVITTTSGSSNEPSGILRTNESDTVCVRYAYANGGACTNVSVVVDPCTKTPSPPTGITGGSLAANKKSFTLSWTAPTTNSDSTAIAGLSGYDIWEKVCASTSACTGSNLKKDWFLRTSITPGTTLSAVITADQSTDFTSRAYYFKVRAKNSCSNISVDSSVWNETW